MARTTRGADRRLSGSIILRYAGIDDVRVLDGGYDAWVRAGHAVETVIREPSPVVATGLAIPQRPELIIDLPEAKKVLADAAGAALVSVRTWEEHIGAISGYNYIGPAGRIAGDVWGNCGSDAYHMQHYRTVDNTMRSYAEIAANWAEAGITPDKHALSIAGPAGEPRRRGSMPTSWAGHASRSTTAAGSNGAPTRPPTPSRSVSRSWRAKPSPDAPSSGQKRTTAVPGSVRG